MFSATKLVAATAILALSGAFVASGVLTTAPEQPPGAGSDGYEFVTVSGTGSFSGAGNATGTSEMSDPRVSGNWDITQEFHCAPAGGYTCAKWGQATMTNDGGTWEGEWVGLHQPGDTQLGLHYIMTWLSGTGDHEGLNYVANLMGDPGDTVIEGVIYEGPIPATVAVGAGVQRAADRGDKVGPIGATGPYRRIGRRPR